MVHVSWNNLEIWGGQREMWGSVKSGPTADPILSDEETEAIIQ